MNEDLKDFMDRKQAEYETYITKWEKIKEEKLQEVSKADKEIETFVNLKISLVKDSKKLGD